MFILILECPSIGKFPKHARHSYFHIRALRHIRPSLTTEACKTIAAAIVGSRLDYCNSLLAGTSVSNLTRLQLVQNTLARVVTEKSRFCHITPVLSELHWLPVRHRINFKIATITFKVLQFQQPSYLAALFTVCANTITVDLLLHCHYVFLLEKPRWPSPNHFHLLPRVFGISSQVIFHPFPLFLLSGRNSSTIFFEVPFPVIPHHPLASRFVMSAHPQMRLRSDTPHRLANMFQLSAYD